MAYQVKTTKNYGNRLLDSLKGAGKGFILFGIGTILLFVNEGNYVKNYKTIGDAQKALVKGTSDISTLNPALEGKLIYANGAADTKEVLIDDLFGASEQAITLDRIVEYYQWVQKSKSEKKDKVGGAEETTITYTYEKKWGSFVDSSGFADPAYKGKNIKLANVDEKYQFANNVTFGAYTLPRFIIESISGSVPVDPRVSKDELLAKLGIKAGAQVQVQGNVVYIVSKSSSDPQIGDVRVTLVKVAPPVKISIIAKVIGATFEKFTAPRTGREYWSMGMGTVSAEDMFKRDSNLNKVLTWLLRLLGIFLVIFGLRTAFDILPTLFKVLPPLGKIVGAGVGLVCGVGGGAWSLAVISIAWLFYRPLIGIPLLLAAILGIWFLEKKAKQKKAAAAGSPTPNS